MTAHEGRARSAIGYIALCLGLVIALIAFQHRSDARLRSQINTLARDGCLTGRINTAKYNDLVQSAIDARYDIIKALAGSRHPNVAKLKPRDRRIVLANRKSIQRFRGNFIHVSTEAECERPIL